MKTIDRSVDIHVRPALGSDLPALLPVYRAAAARPDCPWDAFYPDEATLRADVEKGVLFCAWAVPDTLLGAYALTCDAETNALPFWDRALEPAGEVTRLAVCSEWEGRGLGGFLLSDALARLARMGCKGCRILVGKENVRALHAYAGLGFRLAGEARLYDMDFYCFEKALL